ncbi:MAG: tripartite tricarboxylate transporter permease [Halobacteriaceae archaeon]
MEVYGVRILVAPPTTVRALLFIAGGVCLGTVSGLVPGLHVNALALLLAGAAPTIPGPPHLVAATMLAAGVVHTFLDVIPALALGVPDAEMAASALPGHRLVLGGRGREALRLSALGSGGAVLLAIPLAIPVTTIMADLYPIVVQVLPLLLIGVVIVLLWTEEGGRATIGGGTSFAASGALGLLVLPHTLDGFLPVDSVLGPLFSGLFGAPVLLTALDGDGVPAQADAHITVPRRRVGLTAAAGTLAGAIVGFVPGLSSATAATIALTGLPRDTGDRGFLVATSGVNTANSVFALLALLSLGTPRTGVMVAIETASLPLNAPLLVATVAIAAATGTLLVIVLGDWYLARVGRADNRRLSVGVLAFLALLTLGFAGPLGPVVFTAATVVGLLPPRVGCRRVYLMGVLMVPLML